MTAQSCCGRQPEPVHTPPSGGAVTLGAAFHQLDRSIDSAQVNSPFPACRIPSLARPPIELIIAQVRFPTVLSLYEIAGVDRFHSSVRDRYPHIKREEQVEYMLSPTDPPVRGETTSLWRMDDQSREWTLTISPDFITIETRQYRSFDDLRERLSHATSMFVEAFGLRLRTRVGLRYVDRFDRAKYPDLGADWMSATSARLLPMSAFAEALEQRAFIEHRLAIPPKSGLTMRAQWMRGEGTKEELVLDTDAFDFDERPPDDLPELLGRLKELNYRAFGWAAQDILRVLEKAK